MNIKDVDLNLLRVFELVYRERNMSRAAKLLEMTQPAVSNALARLAKVLEQPLFVRAGQGVMPTAFAVSIAEELSGALAMIRHALQGVVFDGRLSNRCFTLICSDYSASVILPRVLQKVREQAPEVSLQVISLHDARDFAQALAQGEADLALGALQFLGGPTRCQRLLDEQIIILARRGHPACTLRGDRALVSRFPHVLVNPYGNWASWETLAERAGIELRVAIRVTTYFALPFLLESADYLASCPERLGRILSAHFPLEMLPLKPALGNIPISQYWHERSQDDPGHQWLRQLVAEVCQEL